MEINTPLNGANAALAAGDNQNALNYIQLYYGSQTGIRGYANDAQQVVSNTGLFGTTANQEIAGAVGADRWASISTKVAVMKTTVDSPTVDLADRSFFRVAAAIVIMAASVSGGATQAEDARSSSDVPTVVSQALPELRHVGTFPAPNEKYGMYQSGTARLTWSPDGKRLAAYVHNGLGIITWSPDGKDQREFPRYTNFGLDAYLLGFVAGHSQIIVSPAAKVKDPDEEEKVQQNAFSVMDAETGEVLRGVPGPNPGKTFRENIAQHLSISPDQRLAAVIYHRYAGRSIGIYSTQGWDRIAVIDLGNDKRTPDPQAITFSPDGRKLAVARGDNSHVDIYEVGSWKMLRSMETFPEAPPPTHVLSLGALAFSPDASMIAVGSRSGGVYRKYSDGTPAPIGRGELVEEFPRDPLRIFRVDDGSLVASVGGFPGGLADESKLAWSPTGEFIAFLDTERHLRLWSPKHPGPPTTALKLEHSAKAG